ncbi:hypothetical protein [Flavobacterium covae]|uniref:hypothetical protein n=1 Tax=Flavobacterium covae TaxID=2906076 RepID=UPI0033934FA4
MFIDSFLEDKIKRSIQKAKIDLESRHVNLKEVPEEILKKKISENFDTLIFFQSHNPKPSILFVDKVKLTKVVLEEKSNSRYKSIIGSGLIIAGQPIIKKRFVMSGSSIGTSIASKYLSKALPQKLPFRVLGTTVVGRAIGRIVPYVGWTLLAIDIVEIIIECTEHKDDAKGFYEGFGGGSFSGGGAGGRF